MLIPNQIVTINWHPRNKKHFEEKGYNYTCIGDLLEVKAEDLMPGSKCKVKVICDYCDEIIEKTYKDFLLNRKKSGKDCCSKCNSKKAMETNQERYGGNSPACSPEIMKKIKETNKKKYGVEWSSQRNEVKEKIRKTCIKKFGTKTASENEEIRQKIIRTNNEKYGGNSSQCDPEIRKKTLKTRFKNGNIPISKQEEKLVNDLKEIYGENNCFPQFILDRISFDCLLIIGEVKIDVEYDGMFWHKDKIKDIRRDYFTIQNGYKVLRFKGNYATPSKE